MHIWHMAIKAHTRTIHIAGAYELSHGSTPGRIIPPKYPGL